MSVIDHQRIQNITYGDSSVTLEFKGTAREANVLRHILLSEIPTMAMDKISVRCNTTTMVDEFLIERIKLIPLIVDAGGLKDTTTFSLTVDQTGGILRSQDIKGDRDVMKDIIIVRMNDDQRFTVDITCHKGIGKVHPCWSAVGNVEFKKVGDNVFKLKAHSIGIYSPKRLLELALKIYDKE